MGRYKLEDKDIASMLVTPYECFKAMYFFDELKRKGFLKTLRVISEEIQDKTGESLPPSTLSNARKAFLAFLKKHPDDVKNVLDGNVGRDVYKDLCQIKKTMGDSKWQALIDFATAQKLVRAKNEQEYKKDLDELKQDLVRLIDLRINNIMKFLDSDLNRNIVDDVEESAGILQNNEELEVAIAEVLIMNAGQRKKRIAKEILKVLEKKLAVKFDKE